HSQTRKFECRESCVSFVRYHGLRLRSLRHVDRVTRFVLREVDHMLVGPCPISRELRPQIANLHLRSTVFLKNSPSPHHWPMPGRARGKKATCAAALRFPSIVGESGSEPSVPSVRTEHLVARPSKGVFGWVRRSKCGMSRIVAHPHEDVPS